MQALANKNVKEERLLMLVGNATDVKLLGVITYNTASGLASGDIIIQHTCNLLKSWNGIVSLRFDTTAANTVHVTVACVAIQSSLDLALQWCACCHQCEKVILDDVFEGLKVEVLKSREISLFKRFQQHWQHTRYVIKVLGLRTQNLFKVN